MGTLAVAAARVTGDNRHEITVGGRTLWYEFEGSLAVTSTADTASVAVLPYAMTTYDRLHVEGDLDRELLANLHEFQDYWALWRPDIFRRIPITADAVVERTPGPISAVAAFSGGVDATYQLIANATGALAARALPIRGAVLVHGFDIAVDDMQGFARAVENARPVLDAVDVPLMTVKTNWREFTPDWETTFAVACASVLHAYRDVAGYGLIAADEPYNMEVHPWGSNSSTNHLLGGVDFRIRSDGFGATRTDKCRLLANHETVRRHLRVCWAGATPGENCGVCEKCIRTKLNWVAVGEMNLPALGPVTTAQIRSIRLRNQAQAAFLIEVLKHDLPPDVESAVKYTLRRYGFERRLRPAASRVKRALRRR